VPVGRAANTWRSPPSIEGRCCKSGGRARKVVRLILGGLALHGFHDVEGHFPPAHFQDPLQIADYYGQPEPYEPHGEEVYFSWMSRILPYLDQAPLYNHIDWETWPWPNPPGGFGSGQYVHSQLIAQYHCPSVPGGAQPFVYDFDEGPAAFEHTHYLGVNGTDQFSFDGILHNNSRIRITDIKDGASNTLLVGERPITNDRVIGWWFGDSGWYPWFGAAGITLGTEERIADLSSSDLGRESTPTSPKSHYQPGSFKGEDDGFGGDKHAWHFWSAHDGGAYFLFADGHVNFIPYSVDHNVFRNLGTYMRGETDNGSF